MAGFMGYLAGCFIARILHFCPSLRTEGIYITENNYTNGTLPWKTENLEMDTAQVSNWSFPPNNMSKGLLSMFPPNMLNFLDFQVGTHVPLFFHISQRKCEK